jgi:hypothetical protein
MALEQQLDHFSVGNRAFKKLVGEFARFGCGSYVPPKTSFDACSRLAMHLPLKEHLQGAFP